jgi:nicotinate-nucleotide adenylyltransferase
MSEKKQRLGIYGGTFSPPHKGHVHAAMAFLRQAELDQLLVMPAAIPPHKRIDGCEDPQVRLAMTRAAFADMDSRITVSDFEIAKAGISYTSETLAHFREITDAELWLLCGTDMFLTLDRWHCPEQIFSLSTIACILRESDEDARFAVQAKAAEYEACFGARIFFITEEPFPVSSTEIRERIRQGRDVSELVPDGVWRTICATNLYKE